MALHPDPLTFISLCTGGGGLDLGVELAIPSARPCLLVEREAFAVAHLVEAMRAGLLADAPVWSDARTLNGRRWRGLVDGVIGGIPCQPHSLAGKRLGRDDERDLWGVARRIFVQSGAWWVLIENVGGMLSSGGAERVWRDLQRLGCAVEGGLFEATEVGASDIRERLFILGVADRDHRRAFREPRDARAAAHGDRSGPSAGTGRHVRNGGIDLGDSSRFGRGEGRAEPGVRGGRGAAGEPDSPLVNTLGRGHDGRPNLAQRGPEGRAAAELAGEGADLRLANAADGQPQVSQGHDGFDGQRAAVGWRQQFAAGAGASGGAVPRDDAAGNAGDRASAHDGGVDGLPLFPPRPGDLDAWRAVLDRAPHLEPAVRRVADGMAPRLDQLRLLGNGVKPLQAAYALRTLATRLAAGGSAGAARLVRLMEAT